MPKLTIEIFEQFTKAINEFVRIKDAMEYMDSLREQAHLFIGLIKAQEKGFPSVVKQLYRFSPSHMQNTTEFDLLFMKILTVHQTKLPIPPEDGEIIDETIIKYMEQFVELTDMLDNWRHETADENGWPASFL